MSDPEVVSRDEWLEARKKLLDKEKELTRHRDEVNAERRRLPMVELEKDYTFEGPDGTVSLRDLFGFRRQLIVYHFMFHPDWDEGCPSCSFVMDNLGHLSHLGARDTTFVAISRAPFEKIDAYKQRMGWMFPWYSSGQSDFNYDFGVTLDPAVKPVEYNYAAWEDEGAPPGGWPHEGPGASAFLRDEERIFHTYSTYARGLDALVGTYHWLDLTPLGRQEEWEQPAGRSDGPMQHWVRRHDEYHEPES